MQADFDVNRLDERALKGGAPVVWGSSSEKLKAWFEVGTELDPEASEEGGRYPDGHEMAGALVCPIYREIVMLSVKDPDGKDVICKRATDLHKREYPEAWARFERTRNLTPFSHLPGATKAITETAAASRIWWVEQVAAMSAETLAEPLRPFVLRAKQYLMIAQGLKPRVQLVA